MTRKEIAKAWTLSVASAHLGNNIRTYSMGFYLGDISSATNIYGGISFPTPCSGTVVDMNDQFTLVKTKPSEFRTIDNRLLDTPVQVGDKIALKFDQLKRFDGTAADGMEDAAVGNVHSFSLSGAESKFPVKWDKRYLGINEKFAEKYQEIQNPYLRDLIRQMEKIPVNGGLRRVVNVLIDAQARDLSFNDPTEERSCEDPPAIRVHVSSKKFTGSVEIAYDRAADTYRITLTPDLQGTEPLALENVYFNDLGPVLEEQIDDGEWLKAKVTLLKAAPKKRAIASAFQPSALAA